MTITQDAHNYIIEVNGKEYHYPKACWSVEDAQKDLEKYFRDVESFESKRKVRK